jgi:hypothetical protein
MHDKRDDYEPITATRRSREPLREDTQPLWRVMLALCGGLALIALLAWWLMSKSPSDGAATSAQSESSAPEVPTDITPDVEVEQEIAPPARDVAPAAEIPQGPTPPSAEPDSAASSEPAAIPPAATPESIPEVVPETELQAPVPPVPAEVSVQFLSADTQVRFELLRQLDPSPPLTTKVGEVAALAPGAYRVVASGAQLEPFEQEIIVDGERALEYTVELCAQREHERESLAGQVVEERACTSTEQCESMFTVLGEHADQLVKDRAFRTQQCAQWRPGAAPDGRWTLNINCGGATLATTCRIEIAEGACTFAEPPRSVRGAACPRAELK